MIKATWMLGAVALHCFMSDGRLGRVVYRLGIYGASRNQACIFLLINWAEKKKGYQFNLET